MAASIRVWLWAFSDCGRSRTCGSTTRPCVVRVDRKPPSARQGCPASGSDYKTGQAVITLGPPNRPRMTSQSWWPSTVIRHKTPSKFQITWSTFLPQLSLTNNLVAPRERPAYSKAAAVSLVQGAFSPGIPARV